MIGIHLQVVPSPSEQLTGCRINVHRSGHILLARPLERIEFSRRALLVEPLCIAGVTIVSKVEFRRDSVGQSRQGTRIPTGGAKTAGSLGLELFCLGADLGNSLVAFGLARARRRLGARLIAGSRMRSRRLVTESRAWLAVCCTMACSRDIPRFTSHGARYDRCRRHSRWSRGCICARRRHATWSRR